VKPTIGHQDSTYCLSKGGGASAGFSFLHFDSVPTLTEAYRYLIHFTTSDDQMKMFRPIWPLHIPIPAECAQSIKPLHHKLETKSTFYRATLSIIQPFIRLLSEDALGEIYKIAQYQLGQAFEKVNQLINQNARSSPVDRAFSQ